MAEGLSVGGLASGLDTNSIITGLINVEMQRVVREEAKQKDYELKLTTFNELKGKLDDFYSKSKEMDKTTNLDIFKATSSDEDVATISGETGATSGNFDIKIQQLASTLKIASKTYAANTSLAGVTGNFKLSVSAAALKADPTVTDVTIAVSATDTLKEIAAKINKTAGAGAKAAVVQVGANDFRLMLTAVDEGTKAFSLTADDASGVLYSAGLGLVNNPALDTTVQARAIKTDFDLRKATGGPATTTTLLTDLWMGVGAGKALSATDVISWTAADPAGNNQSGSLAVTGVTTVQGLLDAINAEFDDGGDQVDVSLNSSGEIVIKDKTGATTGNFSIASWGVADTDNSGTPTGSFGTSTVVQSFSNVISEGKKAFYTLNDIALSSQTNKDNTTIAGTVFNFKQVQTTTAVKLQLDYDKDGIKKKVQEFLDSFNQLVKFIDEKSKVEIKKVGADSANPLSAAAQSNKTQIVKGPFAGDSQILGLKAQLQGLLTNKIDELDSQSLSTYSSLASLGITSEQKTGFLKIDDDKFKDALDTDFEGVKRLFMTSGYSTNPAHEFGTYTKDTKTGVYLVNGTTQQIDTNKAAGTSTMVNATVSGDNNILNSNSGDSKGMAVKAAAGTGAGTMTFVRGVAGQVKNFYDKITNFVDGFMTTTTKNIQKRIDDEKTKISRLEKHVSEIRTRLTQQFSNLELSISKLQQQQAAFGNQISSFKR